LLTERGPNLSLFRMRRKICSRRASEATTTIDNKNKRGGEPQDDQPEDSDEILDSVEDMTSSVVGSGDDRRTNNFTGSGDDR